MSIVLRRILELMPERLCRMELLLIVIVILFTIVTGIWWGRRSIKCDTIEKDHEYEELDRLHLLLNGRNLFLYRRNKHYATRYDALEVENHV